MPPLKHVYWVASSLLFAGSVWTSSWFLSTVTGSVTLYNLAVAFKVAELNRFQDMPQRQAALMELLRRHMARCEGLYEYVRPESLYVEISHLSFEDQGVVGYFWNDPKPVWLTRFHLSAFWKDVRLLGEGEVHAEGDFRSLMDYRFTEITAHVKFPRSAKVSVLEGSVIDV